jgi:hypothetical protein
MWDASSYVDRQRGLPLWAQALCPERSSVSQPARGIICSAVVKVARWEDFERASKASKAKRRERVSGGTTRTWVTLAEVGQELGRDAVRVVREVDDGCAQQQTALISRGSHGRFTLESAVADAEAWRQLMSSHTMERGAQSAGMQLRQCSCLSLSRFSVHAVVVISATYADVQRLPGPA